MKATITSIIVALILIGGAVILAGRGSSNDGALSANNVSIVDGKQIIEINAKGGYQPRKSVAKAGIPTILRFNTAGTFDCSISVRLPSINVSKLLPSTGSTDVDIGSVDPGTFRGSCSMGMYHFEVQFVQ